MSESPVMMKDEKKKGYDKYELESAVRDLERAEEIKADPKLMDALQPFLKKKMKSIQGLRALSKEKKLEMLEGE